MQRFVTLVRRPALRSAAAAIGVLIMVGTLPLHPAPARAATLPSGFADRVVISGLTNPTNVEFAPDGRVFVAEKSGLVKVFPSLDTTTPSIFADLRTEVDDYWDRGLLGLALDPKFPARPYVYVLYTYDHIIGDPAPPPRWRDACPTPPGPNTDGCVVSARLSRLTADGDSGAMVAGGERVLIEGWCQQFPSHTVGDLAFGADGALYVSGGDGASFTVVDYGQYGGVNTGDKANPCGDPPAAAGTALAPPGAQGGALRSQSPRRPAGQPTVLSGAILRVDPDTGEALPDNPLASRTDANARRIIAYGLRNPFRFTFRPGTSEVWMGDVGWNAWEEIDRIADPTGQVSNFGWPCMEGDARQPGYDAADLSSCESLYTSGGTTAPYYAYSHAGGVVSGDGCPTPTSASTSGIAFYRGGAYPSRYDGALFFADYSRDCIWAMLSGDGGLPDPNRREQLVTGAAGPVELEIGPAGDLFYVDLLGGGLHRIVYTPGNQAPSAVAGATPTSGPAPLDVDFDAAGSGDPDPNDSVSYAWDFTGDGTVDSTSARASFTYQDAGSYLATLRVTDEHGLSSSDAVAITVGNSPPAVAIDTPSPSLTWRIGETIGFSGHATDPQDGNLPAAALRWSLSLHHCSTPTDCHVHPLQDFTGVSAGSFAAPDHDYPSWLELRLGGTDSGGLTDTVSLRLDPKAVNLTFTSSPSGLQLAVGSQTGTAPLTRTVIAGAAVSVSAPWPQTLGGQTYAFSSWSDGGAQSHTVTAPEVPTTYTARYAAYTSSNWYLRNANSAGPYDVKVAYGQPGDTPVVGDWDGDGSGTVGTFRDGVWSLRNSNTSGPAELRFNYGRGTDQVVVGDWNRDGIDTPGVFRNGVWYLRNANSAGQPDVAPFNYGVAGDRVVVGDWNGDGIDTPGVFRNGVWYLRNGNSAGQPNIAPFNYGRSTDIIVVGDWNGDGIDTPGVIRNGVWYLRNANSAGQPNIAFSYGTAGELPRVGDWNGDGTATPGTFR